MIFHKHQWVTEHVRFNGMGKFLVAYQTCSCGDFRETFSNNYKSVGLTRKEFLELTSWRKCEA